MARRLRRHPALEHGFRRRTAHGQLDVSQRCSVDATSIPAPAGEPNVSGASQALRYVAPLPVPDYVDPIADFTGNWSAAMAPVDQSGFVLLVQSPRLVQRSMRELLVAALLAVGLPFAVALAVIGLFGLAAPARSPNRARQNV